MTGESISRRHLIQGASGLTIFSACAPILSGNDDAPQGVRPLAIATWNFGKVAVEKALVVLKQGGSTLDAVEHGIRVVESSGGTSVGLTGRPNAAGFVQQDACIMHGPGHRAGSVAGLEGIVHPISAARLVMEKTRHVMLVGEGARQFAIKTQLESIPVNEHPSKAETWWRDLTLPYKQENFQPPPEGKVTGRETQESDHDTVTLLVMGGDGTISGGCSTSGLADKFPGRVGDSPIIGSGLYVDNEVGAAGATGIGENIMRYCASLLIVEAMRRGTSPKEACLEVIHRLQKTEGTDQLDICFVALDKHGRFGAAGTTEFPHAVAYEGFSEVLTSPPA